MSNHAIGVIEGKQKNYGEAQSAESRSDFIHKMKVCLGMVTYDCQG